jgi:hypothetical protein
VRGDEGEGGGRKGGQSFGFAGEAGELGAVAGVEEEADAAQKGEIGEDVGVSAAGAVFAQSGVAAVVVAIFDASPVGADQVDPVFRAAMIPGLAGEVEAFFVALLVGLFEQSGAADFEDDPTGGEPGGQRRGGAEADFAGFDAAVSAGGLGKKGDSAGLMRASSSREG